MLQIIVFLLVSVLVLQGVGIFQTAYVSQSETRKVGMMVGGGTIVLSVVIGVFAIYMSAMIGGVTQ